MHARDYASKVLLEPGVGRVSPPMNPSAGGAPWVQTQSSGPEFQPCLTRDSTAHEHMLGCDKDGLIDTI